MGYNALGPGCYGMAKRRAPKPRRGSKSVFIFPDIHCGPDYDAKAVSCALKIQAYYQPDETIFLGDMLDCHLFSAHPARSINDAKIEDFFSSEVEPANDILDAASENTRKLIFIEGNHENRILRMAATNKVMAQFYNVIRPEKMLGFNNMVGSRKLTRKGLRSEYISYDGPLPHYKITPKCIAIHGWSIAANFARTHMNKLGNCISVVCGHVHRTQTHRSRNALTGEVYTSWSPGCLSTLQPSYVYHSPTEWTQGVTIMYCSLKTGLFEKYDIGIADGVAILPDGTKIVGVAS